MIKKTIALVVSLSFFSYAEKPAEILRQTVLDNYPTATVVSRPSKGLKMQLPDLDGRQRFAYQATLGRVHMVDGTEIDTGWQAGTGGWDFQTVSSSAPYRASARSTFNAGSLFEYRQHPADGGAFVVFDPQSISWIDENTSRQQISIKQNVTPTIVNSDTLRWTGAYGTGFDYSIATKTGKILKLLTIDQSSRLPAPTVTGNSIWLELEFSMTFDSGLRVFIDNVEWPRTNGVRVQTPSRIEWRAANGTTNLWWLDLPRAYDSSDERNETIGQYEVRRQGGPGSLFITVRIPKTWIDSAQFPVFIDPTVDVDVAASLDDVFEVTGTNWITGSTGNLSDATNEWIGIRWAIADDLTGATITTAYIDPEFTSSTLDEPNHAVNFEDAASPSAFESTCPGSIDCLSVRTFTTASVTLGDGTNLGVSNGARWSTVATPPSIVTIIQELVDSYGGSITHMNAAIRSASGNTAHDFGINSYDNGASSAETLYFEYTAGGGGGGNPATKRQIIIVQ